MAFCVNCGTKNEEGIKFCPSCGTPVLSAGVEIKQDKAVNIIQTQPAALPMSSVSSNQNTLMADEKYCFSCGSVIKKAAEICPKCGVNQSTRSSTAAIDVYCTSCGKSIKKEAAICPFCGVAQTNASQKNKVAAILLGIFLSAHRIYVGKIGTGILMIFLYVFGYFMISLGAVEYDDGITGVGVLCLLGWIIWLIIDIVGIARGTFTDKQGRPLKKS